MFKDWAVEEEQVQATEAALGSPVAAAGASSGTVVTPTSAGANLRPVLRRGNSTLNAELIEQYYELRNRLGSGNSSVVRVGVERATGNKYAVKIIERRKLHNLPKGKESVFDEVRVLQSLQHRNVIYVKEVFESSKHFCMVLELVTGGDLFRRLQEKVRLSEPETRYFFGEICEGVRYLHACGVTHRDLKPENILLSHRGRNPEVKLSDFGLSKLKRAGSVMKTRCGTPAYVAPEVLADRHSEYSHAIDMWALGVILYIMLCGYPPFVSEDEENEFALFHLIRRGTFSFPPQDWDSVSDAAKDLVSKLIVVDPAKRFTIEQTLAHTWLRGHARDDLPPVPGFPKQEKENAEAVVARKRAAAEQAPDAHKRARQATDKGACDVPPPSAVVMRTPSNNE